MGIIKMASKKNFKKYALHRFADGGAINLDDVKDQLENIKDYPSQDQGLEGLPWRTELPSIPDIPVKDDTVGSRVEVVAPKNIKESALKKMADGGMINPDNGTSIDPNFKQQDGDPLEQTGQTDPGNMEHIVNGLASGIGTASLAEGASGIPAFLKGLGEKGAINLGGRMVSTPEEIENTLNNIVGGLSKGDKIPMGPGSLEYVGKQAGLPEHGVPDMHLFNTFDMNNPTLPDGTTKTIQSLAQELGSK